MAAKKLKRRKKRTTFLHCYSENHRLQLDLWM